MYRKLSAAIIVLAMICVSFAAVSLTVPAEAVHGPFELKTGNWPTVAVEYQDQMQDSHSVLWTHQPIYTYMAQTFVPSQTGPISKVDLYVMYDSGMGFLDVSIYESTGGSPGAFTGAQMSVNWDMIPGGDWLTVEFPSKPTLNLGTEYSIILQVSSLSYHWGFEQFDPYLPGFGLYYDGGMITLPDTGDFAFRTYYEADNPATLDKVAWAGDGNTALAVDGMTDNLYEFTRETGQWSNWGPQDLPGSKFNDIVWSPVTSMFYIVGQNSGAFAAAWGWSYSGGSWYSYPPCTSGIFHGVEYAQAGDAPYIFIAVGEEFGAPNKALIASYLPASWNIESFEYGNPDGDVVYDIAWDHGGSGAYLTAGYEGDTGYGVVYWLGAPTILAQDLGVILNWSAAIPVINALDWCPSGSYGLLVGQPGGPGVGNAIRLENSYVQPLIIHDSTETLNDVDWYPAADMAVIVGEHGGNGVVLNHIALSNEVVDVSAQLPPGTGPLYGVACKAATSPRSAIILSAGGAVAAFPQAQDINTQIRVNSAFPHIFAINMWDQATAVGLTGASLLNQEVDVGGIYTFFIEANYTIGGVDEWWNAAEVDLTAWYDNGAIQAGSNVGDTTWTADDERTRQFRITYNLGMNASTMFYPVGFPNEFDIHSTYAHPTTFPGAIHRLYINVSFNLQTFAADGNLFAFGNSGDILDINQLLDSNSWDFNYSVYDSSFPSAREEAYEEFGIKQSVATRQ